VRGISAITVNGHASEIHACTFEEQRRVLDLALEEAGDRLPVINGVYADGSLEAARIARMSADAGASGLLVFPPHPIGMMDGQRRPEMALAHFRAIADATDLPIVVFQYANTYAYPLDTMLAMIDAVPTIRAVKDKSPPMAYERLVRTLQGLDRPVNVLTTHSPTLLSALVVGAKGLLSGSGSIVADLQVALFEAVQAGDLARARAVADRIHPTARCFYAAPSCDMHNRMKEGLVLLGRLPRAVVRPPLVKLSEAEIARVAKALEDAGVARDGALPRAA